MELDEAARRLAAGGLAVYPTETFYAIGCRADLAESVRRVFAVKRRPSDKPLPLIAGSAAMAFDWLRPAPAVSDDLRALSELWPGPLTLLLPASPALPCEVTAGTGMAAVRVSGHAAARELSLRCGFPIISSSANISGRPPARLPSELDPELLGMLDMPADALVTEGPDPSGGAPSTIIEPLGGRRYRLLRPGALPCGLLADRGFLPYE